MFERAVSGWLAERSAAGWVAETEWGAKRAANGRREPYGVKYWAVGNEMYGHWQYGHMARDQYTVKHNMFVDAMRKVDPDNLHWGW